MIAVGEYPTLENGWHYTKQEDFPIINEAYSARVWVWYGRSLYGVCSYEPNHRKPWEDIFEWCEDDSACKRYGAYEVIAWHVLPICTNEKR